METPDFIIHEDAEIYHQKAKQYQSSHQLALFRKCPFQWLMQHKGQIENKDSAAYQFGRAAHTLILEGREVFESQYQVGGGPINPTTGKEFGYDTKKYQEWLATQTREVIPLAMYGQLEMMRAAVRSHDAANMYLSDGIPEAVVRAEVNGVECQIRIDWYRRDVQIIDLKTCDDLDYMEADFSRYGYDYQLAFYHAVLIQKIPGLYNVPCRIVAVEKREPYRVGVWTISKDRLKECMAENSAALGRFKQCKMDQSFPTNYEQPRIYVGRK